MPEKIGHSMKMTPERRFICDLLHAGMQVPLVTIQKDMNLAELVAARKTLNPRPSWCSIFTSVWQDGGGSVRHAAGVLDLSMAANV